MFARTAFRTMGPARCQARRFASEAPKNTPPTGGGSSPLMYVAVAVAGLGAAGYYMMGPSAVQKAGDKAKEAAAGAAASTSVKKAFTGGDQGFVSLKLAAVEDVNHNTKKFKFELPEGDMVSGLVIASAILTKFQAPGMEKPVVRPYTPVSNEDDKGHVDLLIKKYPDGAMSSHMHDMEPGQRLDFKGPLPKYPWSPNKHRHIALVAGGTGITPMYQLARAIFANPEDKTKVTLVFANITEQDILLKREFEDLENTYPQRFRAFYVLDKPPKGWVGGKGFISEDLLKTVLPEPKEEDVKVFVCGPPGMMKAISGPKKSPRDQGELDGVLKQLGYSQDQVYKF